MLNQHQKEFFTFNLYWKQEAMMIWCIGLMFLASATAMWRKEMENPNLFNGDMILTPAQLSQVKDGKAYGSIIGYRWPNAKVPYEIDRSIGSTGRSAIQAAINDYHKYTCLRFAPRRGESGYIRFYSGGGCSSPVGYHRRKNSISLGRGCQNKGTAIHEIGHSIGLYHEQNRPDRDQYIRINRNNVQSGMYYNFQKERNINSLDTPYDLRSIMHYGSTAFARNYRYKTITTIDQSQQHLIDHGDRISDFSPIDIKQINLMYNCAGGGPSLPPPTCENRHTRCDEWANRGECKINPRYMLNMCKKACKVC